MWRVFVFFRYLFICRCRAEDSVNSVGTAEDGLAVEPVDSCQIEGKSREPLADLRCTPKSTFVCEHLIDKVATAGERVLYRVEKFSALLVRDIPQGKVAKNKGVALFDLNEVILPAHIAKRLRDS